MWGRMPSCGGLVTRLVHVSDRVRSRLTKPAQDAILPHMPSIADFSQVAHFAAVVEWVSGERAARNFSSPSGVWFSSLDVYYAGAASRISSATWPNFSKFFPNRALS